MIKKAQTLTPNFMSNQDPKDIFRDDGKKNQTCLGSKLALGNIEPGTLSYFRNKKCQRILIQFDFYWDILEVVRSGSLFLNVVISGEN